MAKNPWLTEPDPYFNHHKIGIEENIGILPKQLELERLSYMVFIASEDGQALYKIIEEQYIKQGLFNPIQPNADKIALYFEGFKEAFRGLYKMACHHQERINKMQEQK